MRGSRPDFISCFRVPPLLSRSLHANRNEFTNNLVTAIEECRNVSPKKEVIQAANRIFGMLKTFSGCKINSRVVL